MPSAGVQTPSLAARTANDKDILAAASAAGITCASDLNVVVEMAKLGDAYAKEIREDAKAQAVRAYGPELGSQLSGQCDALPVLTLAAMRDGWCKEADKRFGFGKDGSAPPRASAPQKLAVSAENGSEGENAQRPWLSLTEKQRETALKMNPKLATPEAQDKFAAQYMADKAEKED